MHSEPPRLQDGRQSGSDWPLTDAMIAELATQVGFEGIGVVIASARDGEGRAKRRLRDLSVQLSRMEFMTSWRGTTEIATASGAFSAELKIHFPVAPHGPQKTTHTRPGAAADNVPRSQFIPSAASMVPSPWRELARRAGFRVSTFNKSEIEVVDMVDRVLVQRKGWGPKDGARLTRTAINLVPSRLHEHGLRMSTRTYQRAIARLVADKILLVVGSEPGGTRLHVPFWWPKDSEDEAVTAWRLHVSAPSRDSAVSDPCRTNVAPLSHQCRTDVAPPVATRTAGTRFVCRRIGPVGVRHLGGPLTSYFDYKHLNECGTAFHGLDTRDAPCLPNGQARRAVRLSGGDADDLK